MDTYTIFKDLAIIIIAAKGMGIVARKCKAPQVVGEILAGLLIGPSLLGWVQLSSFLSDAAEIGVVMIMFSAGLGTDIKELKRCGLASTLIACAGVAVPLVGGTLLYFAFYGAGAVGSEEFYKALFMGTIMTATSVSITVESLKEMGKLKGKVGTTIMGAAIIDDVIGIVVLTVVIGFRDPKENPGKVVLNVLLFFIFAIVVGFFAYKGFKLIDKRHPHTRRIPILGLAFCLFMAYIAEEFFGIADITGAYVAGIILCSIHDSEYIARKMDINSYMIFGPVFFASIGLKTNIKGMTLKIFIFSLCFVAVAMICKVIGCGLMARMWFNKRDSLKIGVGMMTRGEVALIVSQKGLQCGLLDSVYFTSVILLIIFSSILTPVILKLVYEHDPKEPGGGTPQVAVSAGSSAS